MTKFDQCYQNSATKPRKKIFAEVEPVSETLELPLDQAEPIDTSMRYPVWFCQVKAMQNHSFLFGTEV